MITRRRGSKQPFIRESVVKRFEKICGFLGKNGDRFVTAGFADLQQHRVRQNSGVRAVAVKGRPWDMVERVVEQVAHRMERRVR
ncbi:MAG: hypothetical protein ABI383_13230 [Acidobacteriaceae bacterium]